MWTLFWDMHSGDGVKEQNVQGEEITKIYIEAPEDEAIKIFYNRFDHNPNRVSCGEDYSISEESSFAQISGYHRNCGWDKETNSYSDEIQSEYTDRKVISIEKYKKQPEVLIISTD